MGRFLEETFLFLSLYAVFFEKPFCFCRRHLGVGHCVSLSLRKLFVLCRHLFVFCASVPRRRLGVGHCGLFYRRGLFVFFRLILVSLFLLHDFSIVHWGLKCSGSQSCGLTLRATEAGVHLAQPCFFLCLCISHVQCLISSLQTSCGCSVMADAGAHAGRQLFELHSHMGVPVTRVQFVVPPGMPTAEAVQEKLFWDRRVWHRLPRPMKDRLVRNIQMSTGSSRFRGIGRVEVNILLIVIATNCARGIPIDHVLFTNAAEPAPSRQRVLLSHAHGPRCIHAKIKERLPSEVYYKCLRVLPNSSVCQEAKRLTYRKICQLASDTFVSQPALWQGTMYHAS